MDGVSQFRYFQYEPIALEQAAKSGLFSKDQSWQLNVLSQNIRNWNFKVSLAIASMGAPTTDTGRTQRLEWVVENIDRSRQGLLKDIELLAQKLKIEIPATGTSY